MEMINTYGKPMAVYVGAAAMSWIASRYHLSGEQVAAITADFGTVAAIAYGVWSHGQASKGASK